MAKTLSVNLTRLEDQLLAYLASQQPLQPAQQVRTLIGQAELLKGRGLLRPCAKVLRKARSLAERHHLCHELLQIGVLEKAVLFRLKQREVSLNIQELLQKDQKALQDLSEIVHCHGWAVEVHGAAKLGAAAEAAHRELPRPSHPLALMHWLQAKGTVALGAGNFGQASSAFEEMAALWKQHETDFPGHDASVALTNYLGSCIASRKLDDAARVLNLLKDLHPQNHYEATRLRENLLYAEQIYCLNIGDFEGAVALLPTIEEFLRESVRKLPASKVLSLLYNTGIAFFALGEWSKSLALFNRIYQAGRLEYRRDVQNAVRLLRLPLHIELGNHDLVESMARSVQREWEREGWPDRGERSIVRFFQRASKSFGKEVSMAAAELERHILEAQLIDAGPGYREFTFWLRSKASGNNLLFIFREAIQAHS